jgi:hypothetical protein
MGGACSAYGGRRGEYRVLVGKTEGDHLGGPDVAGRIILRWIFRTWDVGVWNRSSWLRIWTGGGHFEFHKMLGISSLAEKLLVSQEGLCSME